MVDPRVEKMAQVIVNYSAAVKPGEIVFIRGLTHLAEPLVKELYCKTLQAGAYAFPFLHIGSEDLIAIEAADDIGLLAKPNPMLTHVYQEADVIIAIHAADALHDLSGYPAEKQDARSRARQAPLKIQMERQAAKTLRRCTTLFPTPAYAQKAGMSLEQYADFVFRACKVHLDDPIAAWNALRVEQERIVRFLKGKKRLQVIGENIDLTMSIEDRTFINSSGSGNFPDGEIFTGPVEDSVNGWIRFTFPTSYNSVEVEGVELQFEDGQVVKATADKNEDFLLRTLDTDDNSRTLGEFAIGTNKDIQQFTGQVLFDEKIGGTVHLALGQGYPQTGSKSQSDIHWDMVCDMRGGGEILAGNVLFYKDGNFLLD